MEALESFKTVTLWLAAATEAVAALIIGLAVIQATLRAVAAFVRHSAMGAPAKQYYDQKEEIRLRLGRWLALGLEFLLVADILRTAVAPTWNEIGQLAAIAVLRTALNYFLQKEIDKAEERERSRARAPHEPAKTAP